MIARGLDGALGVADALQDATTLLEILAKDLFLLRNFGEQDAELVGEVGDGVVVGLLTPVGQLAGNGGALATGRLVSTDCIGL